MQILKKLVVVIVLFAAFISAVYHFYIKGRRRKDRTPERLNKLAIDLPAVNFEMFIDFYHNPDSYTIMIAEQPDKAGIEIGAPVRIYCSETGKEAAAPVYVVDKEVKPYGVVLKLAKKTEE